MLQIDHLTKMYGNQAAVSDLSLFIAPGEIYGFIGHNGAGKTTTLKSCAGILNFEAGRILVNQYDIRTQPMEAKRTMAYLPDEPTMYEFLTGIQYLNFVADMYQVPDQMRNDRIAHYADMLEMTPHLASPISSYSHGMKQKLAIISALIHDPALIMMDEPFVGLDPKASYLVKQVMHDLCRQGCSIFFSTHVLEVAEKLCDKIAIIKQGHLIACGPTDEVRGNQSLESVFLELEG